MDSASRIRGSFLSGARDLPAARRFDWPADGLVFGADYNPEQWPREVWRKDVDLMRRAGVNTVSLGIFSWGLLETADGRFEWDWLDESVDLLHDNGIGVNLATPTAAPPMWLFEAHPEIATVDARGVRTSRGGRLGWSASSATFRRYALRIVGELGKRYGSHPGLKMWHVGNEFGNENARCFSDETALAWQRWLRRRFGDIEELNDAWGTAFWGHRYTSFGQVQPPRETRTSHNPGLLLDFERFSSDALLEHYRAERDLLRRLTPGIPITTNFMIHSGAAPVDYVDWAGETDLVANDHYTKAARPDRMVELAFSADRTRGIAAGKPWWLMEHSTGAVCWRPVNKAKAGGELRRNSLAHVARGADAVMFFQWRQSAAGSEQFHSAMVPHAGADAQIFADVEGLGQDLARLAPVRGTTVERAGVAIIFDHTSMMAWRCGRKPSELVDVTELAFEFYSELFSRNIACDILPWGADLADYQLVVIATQYSAGVAEAAAIQAYVEAGGQVLISYLSGIVDQDNTVALGGYPGAFRELCGVWVDEFFPLLANETVELDNSSTATLWTERVTTRGSSVVTAMKTGALAGWPALTFREVGQGKAFYLAVHPDARGMGALVDALVVESGVEPVAKADQGLELVRRLGDGRSYLFAINHTNKDLSVAASGIDLLSGERLSGAPTIAAGTVRVIDESQDAD
ncbi:MAG: beta-galactosidase [Bifidobacteriaceae bacterium]|jgi:beta-galactosidase|nr:beta-galactosidase [Bifidobacteriaceae bacterium]